MVFFAITRNGFQNFLNLGQITVPLWVAAGILSESELSQLRASGMNITHFNYEIEPGEQEVISCAIETIKEHHPNQCLWVES